MSSFADYFRTWRRKIKALFPYVRRREYRILQRNHAELIEAIDRCTTHATTANIVIAKPIMNGLSGEVCLFVSFMSQPTLKPHVVRHVNHLLAAGIHVVLIVNTDLLANSIKIDDSLIERLSGLLIRENKGYDFAAWAHGLSLCSDVKHITRLYLINDSIFGPLSTQSFNRVIERIRQSSADVLGLTECLMPLRHLQSYFLVFGATALSSEAFRARFEKILNWPSKAQVIEMYEMRLTEAFQSENLRCEALFPSLTNDTLSSDDTSNRWAELIEAGFPYIKTRVMEKHAKDPRVKKWQVLGALNRVE